MKTYILFFVFLMGAGLIYHFWFYEKEQGRETANPASVFCRDQGGESRPLDFEKGTKIFCSFDDGSECEEWAFYRGECQKGQLKKEVLERGQGKMADKGDRVSVHYTGWLESGERFESSLDTGEPFSFVLGEGNVIQGWEQGLVGMKVGEKRKLTIAPELGYGQSGLGDLIPPDSVLVFEVELLGIE